MAYEKTLRGFVDGSVAIPPPTSPLLIYTPSVATPQPAAPISPPASTPAVPPAPAPIESVAAATPSVTPSATLPVQTPAPVKHRSAWFKPKNLAVYILLITIIALGIGVFTVISNKTASNSSQSSESLTKPAEQSTISADGGIQPLHLSRDIVVDNGKSFRATGSMILQNAANSLESFRIQNAAGNNLLVADTVNGRIGIGTAFNGTAALQVGGDIAASGNVSAGNIILTGGVSVNNGVTALNSAGLTIDNVPVCTANGCQIQGQVFNGDANTLNGHSSSFYTNASNLNSGTINGYLLPSSVALRTSANTFSVDSSSAFQIQSSAGTSILSADTSSNTVNMGIAGSTVASSTIHIADSTGASQTVTIGSTSGTSPTTLQAGSSGLTVKSASSTAFVIQKADGTGTILTANTSTATVTLGSASANPVLLVLGIKNTAGDPASCTEGAIYYNSNSASLRGCQSIPNAWQDLSTPAGTILGFAGSIAPGGYLLADGSAISRTTYAALFAVIGTTYGIGDGSTTFNLPDLRGRTPVGLNTSEAVHSNVNALGNNEGVALGNRTPVHNSTVNDPGHRHSYTTYTSQFNSGADQPGIWVGGQTVNTGTSTTGITVGPGGTRPIDTAAYLTINFMVKY